MKDFSRWLEKENMFEKNNNVVSKLVFGRWSNIIPEISIVIPTYQRPDTLRQAVESAINQDIEDYYEIIVLDNECITGSKTEEVMSSFCSKHDNILYFKNEKNIGMFGNWNRIFEIARSKWVVMLHDDDMLMPSYLFKVLSVFRKKKCGIVSVFSEFMEQNEDGLEVSLMCKKQNGMKSIVTKLARKKPLEISTFDNYRSITATPTACAFDREMMIECGGFNEDYFPTADIICFNKITYYYNTVIIPETLAIRRIGENEMKNVMVQCTTNSFSYLNEMQKELYKKNKKRWIADYGATVNHLIFLAKKYAPDMDIKKVLLDNNLPTYWLKVPEPFLKGIMAFFWCKVLLRNLFMGNKA